MQLIKGESSPWINKNSMTSQKFEWQDDYYASSVSPAKLNVMREYIKNQEEHHRKKSFQEEYQELIQQFDFKKISEQNWAEALHPFEFFNPPPEGEGNS